MATLDPHGPAHADFGSCGSPGTRRRACRPQPVRSPHPLMPSTGLAADAARAAFREQLEAKGHVVDNARTAVAGLDAAFASGALVRTAVLDQMLDDIMVALEQDEGQRLGGKSAEAARFILRAMDRELANA